MARIGVSTINLDVGLSRLLDYTFLLFTTINCGAILIFIFTWLCSNELSSSLFNRQAQLIKFFPIITKTGLAIRAHQGHLFETKEKGLVILLPTETNEK